MSIFRIEDTSGFLFRSAKGVAWVSGLFAFIMSVLMTANYIQLATADPLDDPALVALRARYSTDQHDTELKSQIRALDLMARKAFFIRKWQLRTGGIMLLIAAGVFAGSMRIINSVRRRLPQPTSAPQQEAMPNGTRAAFLAVGVILFAVAMLFTFLADRRFPTYNISMADGEKGAGADDSRWTSLPPEVAENWPSFRGPGGLGIAADESPPVSWDVDSGENVVWKASVPLPGPSSPVIWGKLVFVSGSDGESQAVYCWDSLGGELLWQATAGPFPGSPVELPDLNLGAGYAAPSPAADAERVYAIFGSGDLVSIDHDGRIVWGMNLGSVDEIYGHSSSLLIYDDLLIVQYDHEAKAMLYALDSRNGAVVWEVPRDVYSAWSSPVLVPGNGDLELIVAASPYLASYSPRTGEELWRIEKMLGEIASSAAYIEGTLVVINQLMSIWGVNLENREILWEVFDDLPDVASPLAFDNFALIATSFGGLYAIGIDSGEVVWREELPNGFYASPVLAGDTIYLMDRTGTMRMYSADGEFTLKSVSSIPEPSDSTPAFKHNRIYIRGERNLYCIGAAADG